jgi:predicted metal-dependent phosphoesterase TrpH
MIKADLHTHSYYSDGRLSPTELVRQAKKAGIGILTLTDHNSVRGVGEAVDEGKRLGVRIIPAVEIRCQEGEILGYFIDYKKPGLKKALIRSGYHANEKVKRKIIALQRKGFKINFSDFIKLFPHAIENYNKAHIKMYLRTLGLSTKEVEKLKNVRITLPTKKNLKASTVIRIIRKYGAVPVLAHPWLDKKIFLKEKNIRAYVAAGLKGIEFDNGDRTRWGRNRAAVKKIKKYAKKYNLVMTKGTDHHAIFWMKGKGHLLGNTFCDEKVIEQLEKTKLKHK